MRRRMYPGLPHALDRAPKPAALFPLLLLLPLSIAFLQCREKTATPPQIQAIPRFQAVLYGHVVDDQGTDSVTLELTSDSGGIGGSLRTGNAKALRFTAAQAVPLAFDSSAAAITSDFRLRYAVDLCEHTTPTPAGEPFQWGQCFHYQGAQKPSALQWNQALVRVQRLPSAAITRITAAGLPDSASLSSVYRVTGTIRP